LNLIDYSTITVQLAVSTNGLALGMSTGMLADMLPWKWAKRYPWIVTLVLIAIWFPLTLSGSSDLRRLNSAWVNIYFCIMFISYTIRRREWINALGVVSKEVPGSGNSSTGPTDSGGES
jgi:hypothetical protein